MPHAHELDKNAPWWTPFAAGAVGGLIEQIFLHWIDTLAKRKQRGKGLVNWIDVDHKIHGWKQFLNIAEKNSTVASHALHPASTINTTANYAFKVPAIFSDLYYGFSSGLLYKVIQRCYKIGTQDYIKQILMQNAFFREQIEKINGNLNLWSAAISGFIAGIGEIVLTPLDVAKIYFQLNNDAQTKVSFAAVMQKENPYRGSIITASRNGTGSTVLFLTRQWLIDNGIDRDIATMIATAASIVAVAPLDIVKTRIQGTEGKFSSRLLARNVFIEGAHQAFISQRLKTHFAGLAKVEAKDFDLKKVPEKAKLQFKSDIVNALITEKNMPSLTSAFFKVQQEQGFKGVLRGASGYFQGTGLKMATQPLKMAVAFAAGDRVISHITGRPREVTLVDRAVQGVSQCVSSLFGASRVARPALPAPTNTSAAPSPANRK